MRQSVDDELRAQVVGQRPADDFARAEVDDDGQVEPSGGGRDEGDVARENLVDLRGKRRIEEEVRGWAIGSAIAGFWDEMFRRNGPQAALGHDSTHPARGAGVALIGEFFDDAPVAVAPPMRAENTLDVRAHLLVRELGNGGLSRGSPVLQPPYSLPPPRW